MIDTKALRSKVLDLAIQGKLTEQLESDGTAEELYQQIQEEKQAIINDRNGRNDNSIIPMDMNYPLEVPNTWKWIRFGEIGFFRKGPFGSSLTKSMFVPKNDDTVKVYEQQHAIQKNSTLGTYYITKEYFDSKMSGFEVRAGDIIVSCAGTIGETYVMPENIEKGIINQALMRITLVPSIEKRFFLYYFDANLKSDAQSGNGSAITNIPPFDVLKNWYFPLPPLAEQKRIVERVEEIFKLLDIIDEAQKKYSDDVEILKSKLITMGIQGKLTEQLESDGTAEELFEQIQEEKQKLIKEGKIKKEKPLPPVSSEEIPFEIPGSWKWTHLGEIFQHNTGKALNSSNTEGTLFEYLTTSNVYWDKFDFKVIKKMYFTDDEIDKCTIKKGDLLICEGGDIGRSAIWTFDYDMKIQNHLHRLRAYYPKISSRYYLYIMKNYKEFGLIDGRGIGLQGFSSTRVHNLVVPLPPLAEQKRIAEKLDMLLSIIGS